MKNEVKSITYEDDVYVAYDERVVRLFRLFSEINFDYQ